MFDLISYYLEHACLKRPGTVIVSSRSVAVPVIVGFEQVDEFGPVLHQGRKALVALDWVTDRNLSSALRVFSEYPYLPIVPQEYKRTIDSFIFCISNRESECHVLHEITMPIMDWWDKRVIDTTIDNYLNSLV